MNPPLRIGLLDDHAVVRAGYRRLIELEPDLAVVAEFENAEQAYAELSGCRAPSLDVLVVDLSLPGQGGLDLLRRLAQRLPALKTLVFTMHDSPVTVSKCLSAGAGGFVTKSSPPKILVDSLRRVARGEVVLSADVATACSDPSPHSVLSVREFDILQRLLAGDGVDRIADTLSLSAKTVANYQTEIRRKLGVGNAIELLRYARRHGLAAGSLDPPA